jgi:hypothetical protein
LNLSGDAYPAAPHIANFQAAQALDPSADFTLRWDPLNGSTDDFVQVRIEDSNGKKVAGSGLNPGQPDSLNGTATSFTIPAGSLQPGHRYSGSVFIAHGISQNISYGTGFAAYLAQTRFAVEASGTLVQPALRNLILLADGRLQFELSGLGGKTYNIEASTTLNGDWSTVQTVAVQPGSSTIQVIQSRNGKYGFYRAREGN